MSAPAEPAEPTEPTEPLGPVQAVIFDLGGTLLWWPDWTAAAAEKWTAGHARLVATRPDVWPDAGPFVSAMRAAGSRTGPWWKVRSTPAAIRPRSSATASPGSVSARTGRPGSRLSTGTPRR